VTKLFGVLNHVVELNREDRVTILHGINGVGKTKLLELTAALTAGHIWRLMSVPFEKLRVDLDDGTAIEVRREGSEPPRKHKKGHRPWGLSLERVNVANNLVLASWTSYKTTEGQFHPELPPWFEPLTDSVWIDTRTNEKVSAGRIEMVYGIDPRGILSIPEEGLREIVPCERAHLIETQRLLRAPKHRNKLHRSQPHLYSDDDDDTSRVMTVRELVTELRQKIETTQSEFARVTQGLDRTLTERVLQANTSPDDLGETLRTRLEALDAHRKRLERVFLLDVGTFGPTLSPADAGSLSGDRAVMIAVHTDDTEKKFTVLDPLATQLELLLDGMNEKLAPPKKLVLDRHRELSIQRGNETIALDQLSSGEQHELVLLYDLAFRIKPNTLVLIDEPELSLHPVWQEQFLDDILKIASNGRFDVLLATHSPYIIGNRNDLCVELKSEGSAA
jgi:AAA domain, putative AbiEii toxin, Type IV TA system